MSEVRWKTALAIMCLVTLGGCVMAQEDAFRVPVGQRQLLLDDWGIAKMER